MVLVWRYTLTTICFPAISCTIWSHLRWVIYLSGKSICYTELLLLVHSLMNFLDSVPPHLPYKQWGIHISAWWNMNLTVTWKYQYCTYIIMWLSFAASENLMLISRSTSTMDTHSCCTFVGTTIMCHSCFMNILTRWWINNLDYDCANTLSVHFLSAIPNHWWSMKPRLFCIYHLPDIK